MSLSIAFFGFKSPWFEMELFVDTIFLTDFFVIIFSTSENESMNTITDFYENLRHFARTLMVPSVLAIFPWEFFHPPPGTDMDYMFRFFGCVQHVFLD